MTIARIISSTQTALSAMICILIGLVPPPIDSWETLQCILKRGLSSVCGENVKWTNLSAPPNIVNDEDETPTLLLRSVTEADPEDIVDALEKALADELEQAVTCELWASCPAPLPLRPAEGYKVECHQDSNDWTVSASERMRSMGVIHQRQLLSATAVDKLCAACLDAINETEASIKQHHPSVVIGKDAFLFCEIASRGNGRFDLRLDNTTMVTELVEEYILDNASVTEFVSKVLGADYDYDVSVVYSRPGAPAQGWHADGNHVKGAADAGWTDDGCKTRLASPYAVCLFVPLINLTHETGFTQFWPESHCHRDLAGFASVAELTKATWDGKCTMGDGIWYDYRCFHRGMPNRSNGMLRPVLQVIFKKPWYVERANYGTKSIIPNNNVRES